MAGISPRFIYRAEHGLASNLPQIAAYCRALGWSIDVRPSAIFRSGIYVDPLVEERNVKDDRADLHQ